MKGSPGHLPEVWKQNVEKLKKNRHYAKGREAAKRGKDRTKNPYTLSEDILSLLKKRNMWERGFEDVAYSERMIHERKKQNKKELKSYRSDVHIAPEGKHKHKHKHRSKHERYQ